MDSNHCKELVNRPGVPRLGAGLLAALPIHRLGSLWV
jgi:hypothetical protein